MREEKKEEVPFNYFYQLFIKKTNTSFLNAVVGKVEEEILDIFPCFKESILSKEERLEMYHKALFEVCFVYIALTGSKVSDEIPKSPFSLIDTLLKEEEKNIYQDSFIQSLQFIFVDYIACLEKGNPILSQEEEEGLLSTLIVTLDAYGKIADFHAINMDLLEETRLLNKMVSMEYRNELGPLPKVFIHTRHDYR